jgi:hypothetical protein
MLQMLQVSNPFRQVAFTLVGNGRSRREARWEPKKAQKAARWAWLQGGFSGLYHWL